MFLFFVSDFNFDGIVFFPTFTGVFSNARDTQLLYVISFFSIAILVALKKPTAFDDFDKHIS